jgi:hypothetical protein
MLKKEVLDHIHKYVHPFRITNGQSLHLKDIDPADTCGIKLDKGEAAELLSEGTAHLAEEQEMLYAQDRWSGKDSTIKHVMSGVIQAALVRGARSRLPVALCQMPARTRSHRHF